VIAGIPTAAGTSAFTVTVTNSSTPAVSASAAFTLTIGSDPTPLVITTSSTLPSGAMGSAYSQTLAVTGGVSPYSWALASGALPAGLTLSPTGAIAGTPTSPGTSTFSATVYDNSLYYASQSFTLTVGGGGAPPMCNYVLSPAGASFIALGGSGSVSVTTSAGCFWTVTDSLSWITITGIPSGLGNGTVTYQVEANTGSLRSGAFAIGGVSFTVQQASPVPLTLAGSMAQIASAGGWDTSLTLVNLGAAQAEARLNFFAFDGSAWQLPFTFPQQPALGTSVGSTFDQYLNPGATLVLDTTGPASQTVAAGWSQLLTGGNFNGFAIFDYTGQQAVVPLETRNAASYLLAFDDTPPLATGLAIANLATSQENVGVIIRDDTGKQIGTGTISNLAAQGHTYFMLTGPPAGFPAVTAPRGTVEFDTPPGGQISVLGLRANTFPDGSGFALTTLPVLANVGTGGGLMAHVASGGGWQTVFTLVNTGTAAANTTLSFFDDNGNPLSLPLSFPQTGATVTETLVSQAIPAGATLIVVTQGPSTGIPATGSAQLTTNGSVSGFAIFQNAGQEAVVPLEAGGANSLTLAFDNTGGLQTGLAVANSSTQPAAIPATLRDDTGEIQATTTINLLGNGHHSFMLTDPTYGFPTAANIARGTVEFDTPSGGQIGALGIRGATVGGTYRYTTIPVMTK
jgi:hypothetical protein